MADSDNEKRVLEYLQTLIDRASAMKRAVYSQRVQTTEIHAYTARVVNDSAGFHEIRANAIAFTSCLALFQHMDA
jgi:hypothetical protein